MTRPFTMLALVAAAALAGCNNEDHTIVAGSRRTRSDGQCRRQCRLVTLPPSIQASKAYRCKDNSLIYIDWLSDGTARVKKDRNEVGTTGRASAKALRSPATPRPLRSPTTARAARLKPPSIEIRTAPERSGAVFI